MRSIFRNNALRRCFLVCGVILATPLWAADGTITITGEIRDATCTINGGNPNLLVRLPKISKTALKATNDVAGTTPFVIKLTTCPESLTGSVGLYFEPGSTTDYATQNLTAYTSSTEVSTAATTVPSAFGAKASNVQIRLSNLDGSKIPMGVDATEQGASKVVIASNAADLPYLASYVKTATGDVSTGRIVSYVQYSIMYP